MATLAFGAIVMTLINEMTEAPTSWGHFNFANGPLGFELRTPVFLAIRDFRQYIAPEAFGFGLSVEFLPAVAMGGRKSRLAPIIGATIIVFLPNILADLEPFRITAGVIAAIAVVAGLVAWRRAPENALRIALPVALSVAMFVFSLFF
jgi:ABC-type branched-subunit amino acid transport system permease subunit